MRAIDPAHFPNVVAALREAGLDPTRELIPVAPAAHYMMGGIVTDLDARSTLAGLYAVGESSCTGLHGANRLASNSLSECFVFAAPRRRRRAVSSPPQRAPAASRRASWRRCARCPRRRRRARRRARRCGATRASCAPRRASSACSPDPHPLARLIARCALARTESRGAHLRADHPERDPASRPAARDRHRRGGDRLARPGADAGEWPARFIRSSEILAGL